MRVFLDPDFDVSPWPGALRDRNAVVGEVWVGARGFLELLEIELGLSGRFDGDVLRAVSLVPRLLSTDGFWSSSAGADPIGTARRLLGLRDSLAFEGWSGEGGERLQALFAATADLAPGVPDRWGAVRGRVHSGRTPRLDSITLTTTRDHWPGVVVGVIAELEWAGIPVTEAALSGHHHEDGNLALVSSPGRPVLENDDSLMLLRTEGPRVAAEQVASYLRGCEDWPETIIVTPSPILDEALERHGLPTTGAGHPSDSLPLLDVLSLACELMWSPCDPRRALDLLLLPRTPMRSRTARYLASALHEYPAVGSPTWEANLAKSLERIDDEVLRRQEEDWVEHLFAPTVPHASPVEAVHVVHRARRIAAWYASHSITGAQAPGFASAAYVAEVFLQLLDVSCFESLTRSQIRQLLNLARQAVRSPSRHEAQAGLPTVASPGAVTGPAKRVVWWDFSARMRHRLPPSLLRAKERAELEAAGIRLPSAAEHAERLSHRERRALTAAANQLILVCPDRTPDGELNTPHPLWDEIVANAKAPSDSAKLTRRELPVSIAPSPTELLLLPAEHRHWSVPPAVITRRKRESASSIGTLLGCGLRYTLSYLGDVRDGIVAPIRIEPRNLGNTAHRLLEEFARESSFEGGQMEAFFSERGPLLNALLFLPGHDDERAQAEQYVTRAADLLGRVVNRGVRVVEPEQWIEKIVDGQSLGGAIDLTLANADGRVGVVDFKWGGAGKRRRELLDGTHYQLAIYAHLLEAGSVDNVPVAYLILADTSLLTTDPDFFGEGELAGKRASSRVWFSVKKALEQRLHELAGGNITAPAVELSDGERLLSRLKVHDDGRLLHPPGCDYCPHAVQCGLAWRGAQ